ncbi:MAG: polysaccharide biosynthesis C-terminal domain-containing protein [Bacteroidota bacterium]|nr:polysaccharide biosynthesis C-terminal domain-containing protein [Bacteroidota bacterium]
MKINAKITNISGLQLFQLFRFGILFLISIIFSKSQLSTGEIGIYETFLLIAGGVSFFWISGLIQSLMPLFKTSQRYGNSELSKNPLLFNSFLILLLFSSLAGLFVFISNESIAGFLGLHTDKLPYLKILVAYIVLSGPNNLIEYIFLLKNESKRIVLYGVISFSLQLFFVTTPILLGYDLGYGLYGLVAVNMLKFLFLTYLLFRHSKFQVSFLYIREHLGLATPLIFSILLSGSASYVDGFLVSNRFSEATFAIFRYGARELPFVVLLANAFSNAMIPEFSGKINLETSLSILKRRSKKLISYLFPVSIILLLTSKFIYPIIFNPEFKESADVFNIYLLIIISRLIFPQTILIAQKKTKIVMISSMIELFINVSLSIWFISFWEIEGVALATLVAYLSQKLIMTAYLSDKMHIKTSDYIPVKSWLIWSFIISAVYLIVRFVI